MASCKDCMHEKVCNYFEGDLNEEGAEKCVYFKDRTQFVELPCNVGDTVYLIKNHNIYERKVTRIIFDPRTIIQLMAKDYVCYASHIGRNDFGKTVFLTREEAEKALKERENNGK